MKFTAKDLTLAGVIAAIYAAVTLLLQPISFGAVQFRVSEALTILPVLTGAAVPGLFIGCLLANLLGGVSALDVVFGSLATLLAAILTRALRKKTYLAPLPPVLVNALVIGAVLSVAIENFPFWLAAGSVGLGQLGACYALGLPLLWALRKLPASATAGWLRP
jgi:uncharacterized membrane protein